MRLRFLLPGLLAMGLCLLGGCALLDTLAGGVADGSIDASGASGAAGEAAGLSDAQSTALSFGIAWALREAAGQYLRWRGKQSKAEPEVPTEF